MSTNSWIRSVYLYLFALVGLSVTVIGTIMLINLGLKAWIFTKADVRPSFVERPIPLAFDKDLERVEKINACSETCELSESQKKLLATWLDDYQQWKENQSQEQKVDFVTSSRQRQASTAVAMILVGAPLYLYHWMVIKRDRRKEKGAV